MRSGAFLVALALLAPVALAQDAGLRAAVAPAQTVVDAAARIVGLGLEEADRDGTPDEAIATLERLRAFVQGLETDWALPADSSYRAEALAARDYAREVAAEVERIPEAAARTATTVYRCDVAAIRREALADLGVQIAELHAVSEGLRLLAQDPPAGVETSQLIAAAGRIDGWIGDYDIEERCVAEVDPTDPGVPDPFLLLRLSPDLTYPGGKVRVVGSTDAASEVVIEAEAFGFRKVVPVGRQGAFFADLAVPPEAALGVVTLRASAGNLTAEADLVVGRAPSQIVVRGDTTRPLGSDARLTFHLLSPLRARVANATLAITGDLNATVPLRDGAGPLLVASPAAPDSVEVRADYAGDELVRPSGLDVVVVFEALATPAEAPPVEPATPAIERPDVIPVAPSSLWPVALLAALVVLALAAALAFRRRVAPSLPPEAEPPMARSEVAPPAAATWIALFAGLVDALRRAGRLPASFTAREVGTRLRSWGADPGDLVAGFERARYGGEPEPEGVLERARTWLREAWTRVRGATP